MRITRIDAEALLVAEGDQRERELQALAKQLGGYRAQLLETGFTARESFTLVERVLERASLVADDFEFEPLFDPDDDDE